MFLSDKCNIKEVLLYPAMKPEDNEAIEKQRKRVLDARAHDAPGGTSSSPLQVAAAGASAPGSTPAFPPSPPCPATVGGKQVDLATPAGLAALASALGSNTYLGGASPSKEDASVFDAVSKVNKLAVAQYPAVQGWCQTWWLFKPEVRAQWA